MTVPRTRSLARLVAPLALILLVAFLASCGNDEVATTTTVATGTTGTSASGSGTTTTGGSATSKTTKVGGGPPSTPSATLPSTPGGKNPYVDRLPELEKAAKEKPGDLHVLGQLAIGYFQAKDYARAEETYKKMLGIKNSAETHNNLGNVYRDWSKVDQAIKQYQAAIELDPTLVSPYSNLAALYVMTGDVKRATAVTESGIKKTSGAAQKQLQSLLDSLK